MLSVVVGARPRDHDLPATLEAVRSQLDGDCELIVEQHDRRLVPQLWADGIRTARGDWILLTAGGLVPAPDWIESARRIADAADGAAGIGGIIEPGNGLTAVDWAVYFCRYARFDGTHIDAWEPAGDNALYRADALDRYRAQWSGGFWEPFVHDAMRRDGLRLSLDRSLVVRVGRGHRAGAFAWQRFCHGRRNAEDRVVGRGRLSAVAVIARAPLVPAVMAARSGRHVWRHGRHRGRFAVTLPLVLWFYGFWAAGETAGALRVLTRRRS